MKICAGVDIITDVRGQPIEIRRTCLVTMTNRICPGAVAIRVAQACLTSPPPDACGGVVVDNEKRASRR